ISYSVSPIRYQEQLHPYISNQPPILKNTRPHFLINLSLDPTIFQEFKSLQRLLGVEERILDAPTLNMTYRHSDTGSMLVRYDIGGDTGKAAITMSRRDTLPQKSFGVCNGDACAAAGEWGPECEGEVDVGADAGVATEVFVPGPGESVFVRFGKGSLANGVGVFGLFGDCFTVLVLWEEGIGVGRYGGCEDEGYGESGL
ncbi:MAG: hypothetical protein Q9224_006769, partial [Gallowayella concinna]